VKLEDGSRYANELAEPFLSSFNDESSKVVGDTNTLAEKLSDGESTHPGAINSMVMVLPDVETLPVPARVFVDDDPATLVKSATTKPAADVHSTEPTPTADALAACSTAYGLMTAFGSDPSEANYRAALDQLPHLFADVDGKVGDTGRTLAADWQRYSGVFLSGGALTGKQADVIVADILDLASACEGVGQPAWHV
jgi:hypothetical protein